MKSKLLKTAGEPKYTVVADDKYFAVMYIPGKLQSLKVYYTHVQADQVAKDLDAMNVIPDQYSDQWIPRV